MNDSAVREVLEGYLPGSTVLFIRKGDQRMMLAVTGPADQIVTEYQKDGFSVEARPELKKAS